MKLKKLTIIGFKSFADKVTIDFDCEIIGIVGPNGCGKSNIVDAFRWVMGEQSAKSLRGDKMHDVLFAGTDKHKPLNMAEVSVTLTDVGEDLPVPYDEVTITRRLYRSGESEYLINRQPVRLKDIQNLFLGSGIGKNTFSIFEQGKLDQVINLSPMDRRAIFDEAAGIGRFLQRKKETLRKLSQVSENHSRVSDIHHEVEKQTKQLKRQAAQAKNFQENKERLEELEKALLVTRWRNFANKHNDLDRTLNALSEEVKQEHHRIVAIEENLEKTKRDLKEKEGQVKEEQLRLHKAETEAQVQEAQTRQQKQQLVDLEKKEERLKSEREATVAKQTALQKQIEEKKHLLKTASEQAEKFEKAFLKEKELYEQSEQEISTLRKELREAREAHLSSVHKEGDLRASVQEKMLTLQAEKQRIEALKVRIKEGKEEQKRLKNEVVEKQKEVKTLSDAIDMLKAESSQHEGLLASVKKNVLSCQSALQSSQKEITELMARERALLRLKESCEGFSSGAKVILKEPKLKNKVRGLFEVLEPEEKLAPAFHKYAETLVVASQADLEAVLAFAENKKLADFSVVLLEKETFLKGIKVVDTLKKGLKGEVVTDEGYYVDQKGVVFRFNLSNKEGNPFLREAELTTLSKTLSKLTKEQEKLQKELDAHLEEQKNLDEKVRLANEKRRKLEMDHVQHNFALQRSKGDLEKNEQQLAAFEKEEQALMRSTRDQEDLRVLTKKMEEQQKETVRFLQVFKKHEELVESKEQGVQKALSKWQEAQNVYQKAKSGWQQLDQEVRILETSEEQCRERLEKLSKEFEELDDLSKKLAEAIEKRTAESKTQEGRLLELEKSALKEDEALDAFRVQREELENNLTEKRKALSVLEKKRHHLEVTLAEDASRKKGIEQELLERHHLPPEKIVECEASIEGELEEAEKQVRLLRVTIEQAGAVNMTAIEEYQVQAERFAELDRQLIDLEEAKQDLEKIILKLDSESRKIFKETFELVRENFKKNFSILFNGGEANLTFTESPDVLEAGIEIIAKPPGKQMRSISLLSGGEKCLTALALLFSIFEVRPAPFCILDEVDAPLDDSNIERFTNVLQQYIDKTQFIVVTHNKKTMSIADLLLGVSMEDKGVSKLLTLSFQKAALAQNS